MPDPMDPNTVPGQLSRDPSCGHDYYSKEITCEGCRAAYYDLPPQAAFAGGSPSAKIVVPDLPQPTATLCWKQSRAMVRCDRKAEHQGPHSWERDQAHIASLVTRLMSFVQHREGKALCGGGVCNCGALLVLQEAKQIVQTLAAARSSSAEGPTKFDLLEDPTRGLHAVLTRHGIASRVAFPRLVTALVYWAAEAYQSSVPTAAPSEALRAIAAEMETWRDSKAEGVSEEYWNPTLLKIKLWQERIDALVEQT